MDGSQPLIQYWPLGQNVRLAGAGPSCRLVRWWLNRACMRASFPASPFRAWCFLSPCVFGFVLPDATPCWLHGPPLHFGSGLGIGPSLRPRPSLFRDLGLIFKGWSCPWTQNRFGVLWVGLSLRNRKDPVTTISYPCRYYLSVGWQGPRYRYKRPLRVYHFCRYTLTAPQLAR